PRISPSAVFTVLFSIPCGSFSHGGFPMSEAAFATVLDPQVPATIHSGSPNGRAKRGSALIRYDRVAKRYDENRRPIGMRRLARWIRKSMQLRDLRPNNFSVGSFCCGTGQNESALLKRLGFDLAHLYCFDASEGMLSAVEPKLRRFGTPFATRQLDVVRDSF